MKREMIGMLLLVAAVGVAARADDTPVRSWSVGMEGVGSEWGAGKPTFRRHGAGNTDVDFTPTVQVRNEAGPGSTDSYAYAATLGVIRRVVSFGDVNVGLRNEIGWGVTWSRAISAINRSTTTDGQHAEYGIGPDIEFPIPGFPALTLGAQAVFHVQYLESKVGTGRTRHGFNTDLVGQLLTLRYYF